MQTLGGIQVMANRTRGSRPWGQRWCNLLICGALLMLFACAAHRAAADEPHPPRRTRNVVLVTLDGLRWQEVFAGADDSLINKEDGGVKDVDAVQQRFLRDTATERRAALMPFFWNTIAVQGVVFGNPEQNSKAVVTNNLNFSYPGYSELLCGFADPQVDSNAKKNNQNVTVLEWLHQQPELHGQVAAFCSWDVFPFIINEQRSGIPVNAGWEPLTGSCQRPGLTADASNAAALAAADQRLQQLDELSREMPHNWPEVRYDYFTWRGADEYVQINRPRVLYLALGETDDWAHAGRYDLYLDAAQRNDQYIQRLWERLQSMPEYRDCTTLILTTDHGRGDNRVDWKSHGKDIADCQYIWMAVLGPDTPPRQRPAPAAGADAVPEESVTQSQIAATVAGVLGYDYVAAQPKAAAPLPVFAPPSAQQP